MREKYDEEFKKKIIKLYLEEGRTRESIEKEYGVSKASISNWSKKLSKECETNKEKKENYEVMRENSRLKKELLETKKENEFLKKAAAFFAKEVE